MARTVEAWELEKDAYRHWPDEPEAGAGDVVLEIEPDFVAFLNAIGRTRAALAVITRAADAARSELHEQAERF